MYIAYDYLCRQCGKVKEHWADWQEGNEIIRCPYCDEGVMDRQLSVGTIKGGDTPRFKR